jgi:hypothetical protein
MFARPIKQVQEIREQITEILRAEITSPTQGNETEDVFDFVASASLRGEGGCIAWNCRLRKPKMLTRYSALYARKLMIPIRVGMFGDQTDQSLRYAVAGTLLSLLEYRPLLESGIATASTGWLLSAENT